jgi:hypothetical protein
MSFKLGEGEQLVGGRLFVDHTADSLWRALCDFPLEIVETWTSEDVRPGRANEHRLNAVVLKRSWYSPD